MATTAKTKTRSKAAPKPPSRKIDDKAQYERFREFARAHETDDDPRGFDQKVRAIVSSPKQA
jgi:hypothetical protein